MTIVWAGPNSERLQQQKIEKITKHLQSHILLSGEFKQVRRLQGFSRPIESTGIFIYWRDHGLYWETRRPFFQAVTFMPEGMIDWQLPNGAESRKTNNNFMLNKVSSILMSLVGGDLQKINRSFKASWNVRANAWSITLTPVLPMIARTLADIQIAGQQYIHQLIVTTSGNDMSRIYFSHISSADMPDQIQCGHFQDADQHMCNKFTRPTVTQ